MSDYTRTGRKKLWFDLMNDAGVVIQDGDIVVLNDESFDRVMAATNGHAAACFQCGTCSATCPWGLVRPEPVIIRHMVREAQLGVPGWTEALWLCTTCGQCTAHCPRGIDISSVVMGLRSIAAADGHAPAGLPTLMWNLHWDGNPYGRPPSERSNWMAGLNVKEFAAGDEILLYLGCTANYDGRIQKVARALMQIFETAGVSFGVLKDQEPCCGDAARTAGQIGFADEIAANGSKLFRSLGVEKVVAISPHCLDQFVHHFDMPESFSALHYTQFLRELMEAGRLNIEGEMPLKVTFHDPCYLGRQGGDYESPRQVLAGIAGVELVEMEHNREDALCCGGGGGRMWLETPASERFADIRVAEARQTGAEIIGTACPHCVSCLEDGVAGDANLRVADVAELVAWALAKPAPARATAEPAPALPPAEAGVTP